MSYKLFWAAYETESKTCQMVETDSLSYRFSILYDPTPFHGYSLAQFSTVLSERIKYLEDRYSVDSNAQELMLHLKRFKERCNRMQHDKRSIFLYMDKHPRIHEESKTLPCRCLSYRHPDPEKGIVTVDTFEQACVAYVVFQLNGENKAADFWLEIAKQLPH